MPTVFEAEGPGGAPFPIRAPDNPVAHAQLLSQMADGRDRVSRPESLKQAEELELLFDGDVRHDLAPSVNGECSHRSGPPR